MWGPLHISRSCETNQNCIYDPSAISFFHSSPYKITYMLMHEHFVLCHLYKLSSHFAIVFNCCYLLHFFFFFWIFYKEGHLFHIVHVKFSRERPYGLYFWICKFMQVLVIAVLLKFIMRRRFSIIQVLLNM